MSLSARREIFKASGTMSQHELSQRAAGARLLPDSVVPPHLLCNSCSNPLFNAFQTPHGCRLCQSCVSSLPPTAAGERRRCPGNTEACRDEQEEIVVSQATCFADMATRRELTSRVVRVQCPNSNAGCTITLTWGQVDSHLETCTFQTLACDLCNKQVMKSNMQHHLTDICEQRTIKCDQCNNMVPFCDMLTKHRNLQSDVCCVKFTSPCPHCNDASRKLDRREYVGHVVECPESPVVCKYSHLGCSVRLRRSEMEEHYKSSSDHHLGLMDAKLRQLGSSLQIIQPAPTSQPAETTEVADVKRRVGSVFDQFKKLQVNVANWAHSTMEIEQMAERFGGVSELRSFLTRVDERTRGVEQMQQQIAQMQQQNAQMQQQNAQMQQQNAQMQQQIIQMQQQFALAVQQHTLPLQQTITQIETQLTLAVPQIAAAR